MGAGRAIRGTATTSFPSGHTASDLSFLFGAAQELPAALVPLSLVTLGSHWSLLRTRKHYPSDIVAGGAIALAVSADRLEDPPPTRRCRPSPSSAGSRTPQTSHSSGGVSPRDPG